MYVILEFIKYWQNVLSVKWGCYSRFWQIPNLSDLESGESRKIYRF